MKKGQNHTEPDERSVYKMMIQGIIHSNPVENLSSIIHEDFLGYGAGKPGALLNSKDLMEITRGRENEPREHSLKIMRKPVLSKFFGEKRSCLFVEEIPRYDQERD